MANAKAGVNYISGSVQGSVNNQYFVNDGTAKDKLGRNPSYDKYLNHSVGDRIVSIDYPLGLNGTPFVHTSGLLDRAPNVPSGWTTKGAVDFGQGKLNRTQQLGPDNVWVKSASSFNYMQPLGSTKTKFSNLST
jgi:hypothetical protein